MEDHAAVERVGASDLASETRAISVSSSSWAVEAQAGACTAGPDFHIPLLDEFYLQCVQEEATAEPKAWGTGDLPYWSTLGNVHCPQVRVTASLTPMGIVGQVTTVAGHAGGPVGAMGAFRLHLRMSRAAAQPPPAAPATGEAGPEEERSGGAPRVDAPGQRGAEEPMGGRAGWSGQRPGRRPRVRAFALVKPLSRVAFLARDSREACPICLAGIRSGELARTLPCFHMLHDTCSVRYFRTRGVPPNCPVCRSPIAPPAKKDAGKEEARGGSEELAR